MFKANFYFNLKINDSWCTSVKSQYYHLLKMSFPTTWMRFFLGIIIVFLIICLTTQLYCYNKYGTDWWFRDFFLREDWMKIPWLVISKKYKYTCADSYMMMFPKKKKKKKIRHGRILNYFRGLALLQTWLFILSFSQWLSMGLANYPLLPPTPSQRAKNTSKYKTPNNDYLKKEIHTSTYIL